MARSAAPLCCTPTLFASTAIGTLASNEIRCERSAEPPKSLCFTKACGSLVASENRCGFWTGPRGRCDPNLPEVHHESEQVAMEGFHADRAFGGDRDHRHPH